MNAKPKVPLLLAILVLAFPAVCPLNSYAQCYLTQGCKPVDDLTYINNTTGQVYHGDGASNNGAGGWTINYSDENQCLGCHYGTDNLPYLQTGHKNTLRKIAPTALWGGPDGNLYLTTDDHYQSGSIYNWVNGQITIGWCNPVSTQVQNGLPVVDPECQYPWYTLPNANAPVPYTPVAPTAAAGGVRNLYYILGAWMNYGGTLNPVASHVNTVFDTGFSGDNYPSANFDCARCHATGYNFDHWAPEPTSNTNDNVTPIPDAKLLRMPTDGFVAPGTTGTSSWYLTGIQCERCHQAAWGYGSHPWAGLQATMVTNEAATPLCMECHRGETIAMAGGSNPGSINPTNGFTTKDHGYCSDLSGSAYATCVANSSNSWIYKPYVDHEQGQAFLNSPHARFTGTLIQNAQHSADLSITISGTYSTQFSESPGDPTKNLGCTGCHDPHQSTVAGTNPPQPPIVQTCDTCHTLSQTIMQTINHPTGPGTPFPTGAPTDIPGACVTCHMQAALGTATSHLFRISSDQNYFTFPTANQLYTQGITALNTENEYSPMDGTTYTSAAWLDVDLACGQCHVGGDGITNPYGLTFPPGLPGAHAYS
ncbi:MAG: cytochrome c3 family protein, partial [Terriglobales bacterium]